MKKAEIHWLDWHRILLGPAPAEFLIEVLLRTLLIYLALLVVLRLLGKRMGGQLTISELAVMLTLGAIVSVPMQIPDRGILQGLVVLVCALAFQRGTNYLAVKSLKIERVLQGTESQLVRNGVLLYKELTALRISREQLLAALRNEGIYNLGEVRRVYIEACGLFSIFKYAEPVPGLSLLPPDDQPAEQELLPEPKMRVCGQCGNPVKNETQAKMACTNCGSNQWVNAVTAK